MATTIDRLGIPTTDSGYAAGIECHLDHSGNRGLVLATGEHYQCQGCGTHVHVSTLRAHLGLPDLHDVIEAKRATTEARRHYETTLAAERELARMSVPASGLVSVRDGMCQVMRSHVELMAEARAKREGAWRALDAAQVALYAAEHPGLRT